MAATSPATAPPNGSETPHFSLVDKAMVALALASVVLVIADVVFRARLVDLGVFATVVWLDLGITLVFVAEFLGSARKSGGIVAYARANWYDVVGMVPLAAFLWIEILAVPGGSWSYMLEHGVPSAEVGRTGVAGFAGVLRSFRLLRIVRILVAGSRFVRATNMTFGEQVAQRLLGRYINIFVDLLTTPIVVAALTQAQRTVAKGRYAESIGKALDEKRPEIHRLVQESLERARLHHVASIPMVDKVISQVEKEVLDAVVDTLTSDELNKIIQDVLNQVLADFKAQMASGEFRKPVTE